ncbi:MAG: hypothetical protein JWM14_1493 [Chitinophagaceae bacterium]|nr:hypothetical protein [Chitinophagaceae bacterium]
MKYIFIFLFLLPLISFSKNADSIALSEHGQRINTLEYQYNNYLKLNDSLRKANLDLLSKVDYDQKIIDRYDTLNTTYTVCIGGLLAAFALYGLFFIIIPSRTTLKKSKKMLDKIKHNMDQLFAEHTAKERDKLIDSLLDSLEMENLTLEINTYLEQIKLEKRKGFNRIQIDRMIDLIKSRQNRDLRTSLWDSLTFAENPYIEKMLLREMQVESLNIPFPVNYFARYNKKDRFPEITEYLLRKNYLFYITHTKRESRTFYIDMFNYDPLVDRTQDEALFRSFANLKSNLREDVELVKQTKMYKKYLERKEEFHPVL